MFEKPAMSCQVLNLNVHSREVGGGGGGGMAMVGGLFLS